MVSAGEVYTMFGKGELWDRAALCHQRLAASEIPHAICGGVAVCLHGYPRSTIDVDLIVRPADMLAVPRVLTDDNLLGGAEWKEFRTASGIAVPFLLSGERAGKGSEVRLPDPAQGDTVTLLEGLPTLSLAKLIESKLACEEGSPRRTHRDFADVVELIVIHQLDGSFARFLHKSLRKTFCELVRRVG